MPAVRLALALLVLITPAATFAQSPATSAPATAAGAQPAPTEPAAKGHDAAVPKAIRIPGTDLLLGIGGYVKVDVIHDLDAIGDAFEFKTSSIPAEGSAAAAQGGVTTIHARETRLSLDLRSAAPDRAFRAFVEGDFFGSGNAFRLRHAYGQVGHLLGGQTWTTFMDISARPLTLDFEGPDGEVFVRQAMVRWTQPLTTHLSLAVAAENPATQFLVPTGMTGTARSTVPDIPAALRYQRRRGHAQVATILRQIRLDGGDTTADMSALGWGVNTTFAITTVGQDALLGQVVAGKGIGRYIEALAGQNVDALLVAGQDLTPLRASGGLVGYTHHWTALLRTGVAFSAASIESAAGLAAATIRRTRDVRVTTLLTPYSHVDVGAEVLWGRRDNIDGSHGEAWRVQGSVIYRIN